MNNNRPLIILACVVVAIVGGSLWFLNKSPDAPSAATPAPVVRQDPGSTTQPSIGTSSPAPTTGTASSPATNVPKATPRPIQPWEQKIDEVLRSPADETQTALILINMLPTMPPEGQEEAAQHIANLILDEQYSNVLPLVKNPNLPEEVLDVFVTDLMNRDDATKLPTLLEIAKIPNHPHHEEALTDLEIFLDDEFGTDWGKWDQAVKKYLKDQAAEEAEDTAAPAAK
jgi:hypothetical protein